MSCRAAPLAASASFRDYLDRQLAEKPSNRPTALGLRLRRVTGGNTAQRRDHDRQRADMTLNKTHTATRARTDRCELNVNGDEQRGRRPRARNREDASLRVSTRPPRKHGMDLFDLGQDMSCTRSDALAASAHCRLRDRQVEGKRRLATRLRSRRRRLSKRRTIGIGGTPSPESRHDHRQSQERASAGQTARPTRSDRHSGTAATSGAVTVRDTYPRASPDGRGGMEDLFDQRSGHELPRAMASRDGAVIRRSHSGTSRATRRT